MEIFFSFSCYLVSKYNSDVYWYVILIRISVSKTKVK